MTMKVKEVADLVGISVRTLHHYDEIGLLTPEETTESGYRLYSDDNLETLQQILFFKELGFPLKKIKEIIDNPSFDRQEALVLHRKMLLEKRSRLDKVISTVDKTIQHSKGEIQMTNKEKFEGFDFSQNPYEQEARERWGNEAVDKANKAASSMTKEKQEEYNAIYRKLATLRNDSPESEQAQEAIQEWYNYLQNFGHYSLDAFKGLGQMYVDDERFTKNIDQFGEGLAKFMQVAMAVYADRNKK
ncbi:MULTISPECIES: MerR family transcriptional regulator [unclassified Bacillus (in: firmicutes)]|uniref:MerR family transcriptional regulator n=1 Tax=unclassified Bacillus (in: firmicutes) TaxID=185979 RepID=UPI0008DFFE1D|nr:MULTISPECIES: MerR family transcriptional regulator [unclassified Bacillus (in: firmicutes)]SFI30172.1 DNA-binding transcriptional regulator, MerR family [Bacillus sp. 71mf]SFS38579.1 DNA-binding transcriptional regulator, MerR family [Bacillus sp. 103mf]